MWQQLGTGFLGLLLLYASAAAQSKEPTAEDTEKIEAIVRGYQENLDRFRTVQYDYRLVVGHADGYHRALQATENQLSRKGLHVDVVEFDGKFMMAGQPFGEPDPPRPQVIDQEVPSDFTYNFTYKYVNIVEQQFQSLWTGTIHLAQTHDSASLRDGNEETAPNKPDGLSPLSMGMTGQTRESWPPALLRGALNRGACRLIGTKFWDGQALTVIEFDSGNRDGSGRNYWFSPTEGFLPIRTQSFRKSADGTRTVTSEAVVTEIKKCANGAFFPMRVVRIHDPDAPLGVEREVVSIVTGSVRVGEEIDKRALQVTLAAGTKVFVAYVRGASVTLEEARRVTAGNLPVLFDQLLRLAPDTENTDPQN